MAPPNSFFVRQGFLWQGSVTISQNSPEVPFSQLFSGKDVEKRNVSSIYFMTLRETKLQLYILQFYNSTIVYDGEHLKATFSVSRIFFNYSWIMMMPQILSLEKLYPETLCVHILVICWPQKNLLISNLYRTSHLRIAHGQRYPMPCLEWLALEVEWEQGSGPKGPMSCRTQGWTVSSVWHYSMRILGLRSWI